MFIFVLAPIAFKNYILFVLIEYNGHSFDDKYNNNNNNFYIPDAVH